MNPPSPDEAGQSDFPLMNPPAVSLPNPSKGKFDRQDAKMEKVER